MYRDYSVGYLRYFDLRLLLPNSMWGVRNPHYIILSVFPLHLFLFYTLLPSVFSILHIQHLFI